MSKNETSQDAVFILPDDPLHQVMRDVFRSMGPEKIMKTLDAIRLERASESEKEV